MQVDKERTYGGNRIRSNNWKEILEVTFMGSRKQVEELVSVK